jgi:hypothetical protein
MSVGESVIHRSIAPFVVYAFGYHASHAKLDS